ncbi:ABC transporter ATP-binding protein [Salipaludibacillus agaradhaerens]|uniref:ABC transporter ATP-binding protein n=1 Tax=Salipaludibacillus agaradhaerens TaxID=76935 RepID=A0A9Q4B0W9_SALAG|nr:ABC transporter ATP-binding protein [Salipaludibacillus agaradhaerens]MCR6096284.1 ABC transporter ATP-binding protein [Salipaludibacillus agaradhaerens]MCR6114157.1 ABC transporter ATP-binding protein [Salipaludibacillus agaradhaerens]
MKQTLSKMLELFNQREKKKLVILLIMMIVAAIFETLGVGLILPFVTMVTDPSIIHEQPILKGIYDFLGFQSTSTFIVFSVGFLLVVFVLKNIYLLAFFYVQYRIILNQQVKLSTRLLKEYLTKPYTFHLQRNSADLLRNVNDEVPKLFQGMILSGFQLLTEVLVIICILALLLITAPLATLTAAALLGTSIVIFFRLFRKKINHLGKEQQVVGGKMIKWVNQSLGASKDVKVSGKESFFINAYRTQSQIRANNGRFMKMLDQAPRLFIETILVSTVLVTMLIIIYQGADTGELITTMALFAMAAFRLMPSISRVIAMVTQIKYSQPALNVVYEDIFENRDATLDDTEAEMKRDNRINSGRHFKEEIVLNKVSYRYPDQEKDAVKDVSLQIPIGSSVAFIGESGAGKTSIVDVILGLLPPTKGEILVDGKSIIDQRRIWQQKIGYIPQFIFLSDDSILGNVAFGIDPEEVDEEAAWRALEQAQLKEFIQTLPESIHTQIGEQGVRLSGGQRQRIGIARALYHNPEILFMDEATSALDNETEKEIMKAIDGLKGEKTLIIIAHRLTTIENCDTVFKMNHGRLISIDNKTSKSIM